MAHSEESRHVFLNRKDHKVPPRAQGFYDYWNLIPKLKFISALVAETVFLLREMPKAKGVC